jgi:glucose/arabinose dehydrogenase
MARSLGGLTDEQLGTIAVSLVVSELRWTPDVAPAVMDRITRDAVAYPEHFDRRPGGPRPLPPRPESHRSVLGTLGRLTVLVVVAVLVAAFVFMAASANAAAALGADASPSPAASASMLPVTSDTADLAIRTDLFVDGLQTPVFVTADGSGSPCLYVVERGGTVRVVDLDGFVRPRPFLDISSLVLEGAEQGLHSIAFHPDFGRSGRFFVHYNDKDGWSVIAEFRGKSCRSAGAKPVKVLLREEQPFVNNNAGWIGFGPDGYLYILLGDGGGTSPGDPNGIGQARSTRLSKVLRIDVDVRRDKLYAIPDSNPYAKQRRSFPPETWAMGLRDPRRASFDRETGDLWIGDVGQDSFEEVDRIPAGVSALNFGWSDMEGDSCHNLPDCDPTAYEAPVLVYERLTPHCGIVGGYVYRGAAIPELRGTYLFSDFCSGFIWGLDTDAVAAGEEVAPRLLLDAPQGFVSFGEDDEGELYLVALDGSIYRLEVEAA